MAKYIKHVTGTGAIGTVMYTVPTGRVAKVRGIMASNIIVYSPTGGILTYLNSNFGQTMMLTDSGANNSQTGSAYHQGSLFIGPGCYIVTNTSGTNHFTLVIIEEDLT